MSEKPGVRADLLPRAVVDTNLFIRALLKSIVVQPLLEAFLSAKFHLVTSEPLLDELAAVLSRPKFSRVIVAAEARELLELIVQRAIVVEPMSNPPEMRKWCEDRRSCLG